MISTLTYCINLTKSLQRVFVIGIAISHADFAVLSVLSYPCITVKCYLCKLKIMLKSLNFIFYDNNVQYTSQ